MHGIDTSNPESEHTSTASFVAWHGTRREFSALDPARSETEHGCFFSDTPEGACPYADGPGGRVLRVELTMTNPFRCTAAEWHAGTAPDPQVVRDDAVYDGYVIDGLDGQVFVAWNVDGIRIVHDEFVFGTFGFDELRSRAVAMGFAEADVDDPQITEPLQARHAIGH